MEGSKHLNIAVPPHPALEHMLHLCGEEVVRRLYITTPLSLATSNKQQQKQAKEHFFFPFRPLLHPNALGSTLL